MERILKKSRQKLRLLHYGILSPFEENKKYLNEEEKRTKIDVVIPTIEKDLKILPLCLQGIRSNVFHEVSNIFIIAPDNDRIIKFCGSNNLQYINEIDYMGFSPMDVNFFSNGKNRSGWIFQQLIKLKGSIGDNENYLVIDSDHVLINKHSFIYNNGPVFYQSGECHWPYYEINKGLTGLDHRSKFSYVGHKLLFNKRYLENLKSLIESYTHSNWIDAIINNLRTDQESPFSEYELYGEYITRNYNSKCTFWKNKNLLYHQIATFDKLCELYSGRYKSVTFPEYLNN